MKISNRKGAKREAITLGAFIHNKQILRCVYEWVRENPGPLFKSKPAQQIAEWCLHHFAEHNEQPGSELLVTGYFEPWEEKTGGSAISDQIDAVLERAEHLWSQNHFLEHQLYTVIESVLRRQQVLLSVAMVDGTSNAESINELVPSALPVTLSREPDYASLFDDPEVGKDLAATVEPVFTFEDEVLSRFFDDTFAPATFTAFQGPEKRGKSQWLLECCMAALKAKKRVLYFDAGDMTKDQIFVRYLSRFAGRPFRGNTSNIEWQGLVADSMLAVDADYIEKEWETPISQKKVMAIKQRAARIFRGRFFSRNFPKGTLTCSTIKGVLDKLTMNGTPIDVVIIDYADIVAPSKSKYQDNRHAVTEIWGDFRTISQTYGVALITATQADAEAYNNDQHQGSFSESKTKNAYVTATLAIDKTIIDVNVFKLSYLFRRNGDTSRSVYVGSDLATSRPAVKVAWVPKKDKQERAPVGRIKNC